VTPRANAAKPHLTPREIQVLQLCAAGRTARQVGQALGIGRWTVYQHRARVLQAFDVGSTVEAVVAAMRCGLLT